MTASPRRAFHYHANAHVLSGQLTRPIQHLIEVQAATSLPTIGGHGKAYVDDFRLEHFVYLKRGYSHVSGSTQDVDGKMHYTTLVTAIAEGVNILDVVTADRIVGRFASNFSFDEGHTEPQFTLVGSRFENLRIAGCKTEVEFDVELFEKIPTYEAARNEFKKNPEFKKMVEDPFAEGEKLPEPKECGTILCSAINLKKLETSCPGVVRRGYCFLIPKFGKLCLGEIIIRHGHRILTMMRFELGSPVSGKGGVVQFQSNGIPWP
jgi:hypothetical protein